MDQKLPPVTEIAMISLALIVASGIYLASHLPERVPLTPAVILLILSAVVMSANIASLLRVKRFHWQRFFAIARWSLLAYAVIAGLLEFVFLRNHVSGGPLVILTLSLVVYAVHVPSLVGFTVARYYEGPET